MFFTSLTGPTPSHTWVTMTPPACGLQEFTSCPNPFFFSPSYSSSPAPEILVLIKMLMLHFLCLSDLNFFCCWHLSLLKVSLYRKLLATYGSGSFKLLCTFHCFQVFSHSLFWLPVLQTQISYRSFKKGTTCSFFPFLLPADQFPMESTGRAGEGSNQRDWTMNPILLSGFSSFFWFLITDLYSASFCFPFFFNWYSQWLSSYFNLHILPWLHVVIFYVIFWLLMPKPSLCSVWKMPFSWGHIIRASKIWE